MGFVEIVRSMPESKPISISLLHLFHFIDIALQKLGPSLTSFLNLKFIILRSPVKHGHDSHRQNLYVPVPYTVSSFASMEDTLS